MSITSYIKEDIVSRIQSGRIDLKELTLECLSQRYEVSLTPVRIAIRELIAEGYVQKGSNRRLSINPKMPSKKLASNSGPESVTDYFQLISNDLVRLSLKGEAVFLREESTAEQYGIKRSALRQIFIRLASLGVLEHMPRKGWRLRPFRQEDLDAFIDMRAVLEVKALDLATDGLIQSTEQVKKILENNRLPESDDDWPENDNSLHALIIECSKNYYIRDFFDRQGKYFELLFDWEGLDRDSRVQAVRQHRGILQAILNEDWQVAAVALEEHIRCNHPYIESLLEEYGAESLGKQE